MNKIKVKSKMSRNQKKGLGGKHTRPKKWSGARRPAGPATTALLVKSIGGGNQYSRTSNNFQIPNNYISSGLIAIFRVHTFSRLMGRSFNIKNK